MLREQFETFMNDVSIKFVGKISQNKGHRLELYLVTFAIMLPTAPYILKIV